jgi:DtxR family transcriptional regulator, Mn-dependent transcriptional regulator
MKHDSFNESAEMYLKTIDELSQPGEPVAIAAVAERLGVSNVSATEMIHRLQEVGLIFHRPYKGISLTETGRDQADVIVRSHRLWECFLADHLGIRWEAVHELACRLEHATEPQIADSLERFLNYPATCPHGNPIPGAKPKSHDPSEIHLSALGSGQTAVITRIFPESETLLGYLADQGLRPGVVVTLKEIAPFNGPYVLESAQGLHYLSHLTVAHVHVRLVEKTP